MFRTYKTCLNIFKSAIVRRSIIQNSIRNVANECCMEPPVPYLDLACKVAVVIGGEKGIGYAAAHEILKEKPIVVGLVGKDVCKGMEAVCNLNCVYGMNKAVFYKADVNCEAELKDAFCRIERDYGHIRLLVNAFGMFDGCEWENEVKTNFIGMVRSTILCQEYIGRNKDGGAIVNVAGVFGLTPLAGAPTISAAQHGVIGLSRSFGHEKLSIRSKIRVVTVCPGITKTELFRDVDTRSLTTYMGNLLKEELREVKPQAPIVCGKGIVYGAKYGASGSVWLVDDSTLYSVQIPCLKTISCLVFRY